MRMKRIINSLHNDILIDKLSDNLKLSECKVLTKGLLVKEGDIVLVKSFQITNVELSSGKQTKVKEAHILGKIYG